MNTRAIQFDDKYALLANISFDVNRMADNFSNQSLLFTPGVTVTYDYYQAQEQGNPNDSINVKSETYSVNNQQLIIRTYTYNNDNKVLSLTIS